MSGLHIIEALLVLFWAGFIGLNVWLLRAPVNEGAAQEGHASLAGINKSYGEDYA